MKKALYILTLLIFSITNAQFEIDSNTYIIKGYKEIVPVELSKKEIKSKTEMWFAKTFNDANSVIKANTDDAIIGKGLFKFYVSYNGVSIKYKLDFTIDVSFKDNKYKFEVTDLVLSGSGVTIPTIIDISQISKEDYKDLASKQYQKQIDEATDRITKKVFTKEIEKLSDDSIVSKMYSDAKILPNTIKEKVKALSESLKSEMNKEEW